MTQLEGRVALVLLTLILLVQVAAFLREPQTAMTADVTQGVQQVEVVGDVTVNGKVQADLGHSTGVWTKSCDEAFPGSECP
jgi:hypothetical protein